MRVAIHRDADLRVTEDLHDRSSGKKYKKCHTRWGDELGTAQHLVISWPHGVECRRRRRKEQAADLAGNWTLRSVAFRMTQSPRR